MDPKEALRLAVEEDRIDDFRLLLKDASPDSTRDALYRGCSTGNIAIIQLLLEHKVDINDCTRMGGSLQNASKEGHLDMVRFLLANGANPNTQFDPVEYGGLVPNSKLPLHLAIQHNHIEIARTLLEAGADINALDCNGMALFLAARAGNLPMVNFLLEHGADIDGKFEDGCCALHVASERGHEDIVRTLLAKGADVNARGTTEEQDNANYGYFDSKEAAWYFGYIGAVDALQSASAKGYLSIVRLLVEGGADVNAKYGYSGNALMLAAKGGHVEVVKFLLERGADLDVRMEDEDKNGNLPTGTALGDAIANEHDEVTLLLLEKGAIPTPESLLAASEKGRHDLVKELLDRGMDVNSKSSRRDIPLEVALRADSLETVKLLLKAGADVNARGGVTLREACRRSNLEMFSLLLWHGADVNTLESPLQAAASRGCEEMVRILLERGANVHGQGCYYGSPLAAAARAGHGRVVKMLIESGADVNEVRGMYSSTMSAASLKEHEDIIGILIENGALGLGPGS